MEKRMITALVLSALILIGFQHFFKGTATKTQPVAAIVPAQQAEQAREEIPPALPSGVSLTQQTAESLDENEAVIETEKYTIVFSDIGGTIKEISLKEYEDDGGEETLLREENPQIRPFSIQSDLIPGLGNSRYKVNRGKGYIEYSFSDPGRAEIVKRFNFYNTFDYIDLTVSFKNLSAGEQTFSYQMIGPSGIQQSSKIMGRRFLEADSMIDDKVVKDSSAKAAKERMGNVSWTALKSRYFAAILKPLQPVKSVVVRQANGELFTALNSQILRVGAARTIEQSYIMYAGPLNEQRIEHVGQDMKNIINYGFFGGVSKALLSVLRFFEKGTKNWGIAIILLTIVINAILFPLTKKSFVSMQQMKKLQPHMQKLKEIHKDNPQKMNKETMELYKKYNVNPFGGCLPLLLQMPIFIALYQGLIRSIELKGANFLWIKDLARPDAVSLPVTLPIIGAHINILPLLMVGVMVLQQKISQGATGAMTAEQASQQKMMMTIFPIFFGFLFYNMPSGLVLYWLTNTILMTVEQGFLNKRLQVS